MLDFHLQDASADSPKENTSSQMLRFLPTIFFKYLPPRKWVVFSRGFCSSYLQIIYTINKVTDRDEPTPQNKRDSQKLKNFKNRGARFGSFLFALKTNGTGCSRDRPSDLQNKWRGHFPTFKKWGGEVFLLTLLWKCHGRIHKYRV